MGISCGTNLWRNPLQNLRPRALGIRKLKRLTVNGRTSIELLLRSRGLVVSIFRRDRSSETKDVVGGTLRFCDTFQRSQSLSSSALKEYLLVV